MKTKKHKGFEYFCDWCYYGMVAVRPIGEKDFNKTQHFISEEKALDWIDNEVIDQEIIEVRNKLGYE
jgi:hypothetical protein